MKITLTACLCGSLLISAARATQPDDLLTRIWNGVQEAQRKYSSACGKITETRTSKLLAKPMVLRGTFCADGLTRFAMEYTEPDRVRIRFNQDYLNVTTGRHEEVMDVGANVRRTQAYFSKENSIANLRKNFIIDAHEDEHGFELKMTPRSARFAHRLNYIIVRLAKPDFLLRSLEIDGASGVHSVFQIDITSTNGKIPPGTFDVYRPK